MITAHPVRRSKSHQSCTPLYNLESIIIVFVADPMRPLPVIVWNGSTIPSCPIRTIRFRMFLPCGLARSLSVMPVARCQCLTRCGGSSHYLGDPSLGHTTNWNMSFPTVFYTIRTGYSVCAKGGAGTLAVPFQTIPLSSYEATTQ